MIFDRKRGIFRHGRQPTTISARSDAPLPPPAYKIDVAPFVDGERVTAAHLNALIDAVKNVKPPEELDTGWINLIPAAGLVPYDSGVMCAARQVGKLVQVAFRYKPTSGTIASGKEFASLPPGIPKPAKTINLPAMVPHGDRSAELILKPNGQLQTYVNGSTKNVGNVACTFTYFI